MTGFVGADVEQLRQLGRELDQQASELASITSRLTGRISAVAWRGPDAQRFIADWNERLANELRRVADGLREASERATRNAREQEDVSGGSGGGLGGVPLPPFSRLPADPFTPVFPASPLLHDDAIGIEFEGRL